MVTNKEATEQTSLDEEWVQARTGIRERRHASSEETVAAMAQAAGAAAIGDAGLVAADIELVIVATCSLSRTIRGVAAEVASGLSTHGPGAFDVNAGGAGFTYALSVASDAVRLGHARHVAVIGSERLSDWIGPEIPDAFAIFGDGAAAAVVSSCENAWIGPPVWGSDGARRAVIQVPEDSALIQMEGNLVYKWALTTMPDIVRQACQRSGFTTDDIAWFVPHQANDRIITGIARTLGIPDDRSSRSLATPATRQRPRCPRHWPGCARRAAPVAATRPSPSLSAPVSHMRPRSSACPKCPWCGRLFWARSAIP